MSSIFNPDLIPEELKIYSNNQWVVWVVVPTGNKKPRKIPINPHNQKAAEVDNPGTWASYEEALKVHSQNSDKYEGIGFVLTIDDPFCVVDLDDCRNPVTGEIESFAEEIVNQINSYTEVSPSGKGLHIFLKGNFPPNGNRKGQIEIYQDGRYLTVTGIHLEGTPKTIEERQEKINKLHNSLFADKADKPTEQRTIQINHVDDDEVIKKAFEAKDGRKFRALFEGNWEGYKSKSEADLALCSLLCFWTQSNHSRIDRIFRQSGLFDDKWDSKRGSSTYGQLTISEAIENLIIYDNPHKENTMPREPFVAYSTLTTNSELRFFNKSTFVSKRLADTLLTRHNIKFASGILWVYQDGVYRPNGKEILEADAQSLLNEEATTKRINESLDYIRRETRCDLPEPNTKYINLKNGRLNWKEGKLEAHNPKIFEIVQLPVTYDPEATCPVFDNYLDTTLEGDVIPLIEEIMGYCLIPDTTFQKAVLLTGSGANGKSVFLDLLTALIGDDNVSNVSLQDLAENKFRLSQLVGKLANIYADLDDTSINQTGIFKTLVSGDKVCAERKFSEPFNFTNYARLLFSANSMPLSKDMSDAYYRRWLIVPFTRTFKGDDVDKSLTSKLIGELSGVLNRALSGLRRLYVNTNSNFTQVMSIQNALDDYKVQNDSLAAFIKECADISTTSSVTKKDFYTAYQKWCEEQGIKPLTHIKLKESMLRISPNIEEKRPNPKEPWYWIGITLNDEVSSNNG